MRRSLLCAVTWLLCGASSALAHYESITWSDITVHTDGSVDYRLQVPFKDLSEALALDDHRAPTVAEVRNGSVRLFAYFLPKLKVRAGDQPCRLVPIRVDNVEASELRAELSFRALCAAANAITIEYAIFFDQDPRHLGIYVVHYPGGELTGELSRRNPILEIPFSSTSHRIFARWGRGIWVAALLIAGIALAWTSRRN